MRAGSPPEEALRPRWVRDHRSSGHGVDFPYHGTLDVGYFFKRYAETLLAVDESVGRGRDDDSDPRRSRLIEGDRVVVPSRHARLHRDSLVACDLSDLG